MTVEGRVLQEATRAVGRAAIAGHSLILTLAVPAEDVDPLAVALAGGAPFAYWEDGRTGFAMAASGEAEIIRVEPGRERFRAATGSLHDLGGRLRQMAAGGAEREPLLIGGFSFGTDSTWPGFPAGRLALPELSFIRRGPDRRVWLAAVRVSPDDDPARVAAELQDRVQAAVRTSSTLDPVRLEAPQAPPEPLSERDDPRFARNVEEAVENIRGGLLRKVTVARRLSIDGRPALGPFLAALRYLYPMCAVFAFGTPEGNVFCGATPELLAGVRGMSVRTMALAGTAARGRSTSEDRRLAERLTSSSKNREEHAHVSSEIHRRLAQGGFVVDPLSPLTVLELPGLLHLATPISAVAPVGTGVLDVVGALHPTPAVGGLPHERALGWIASHEDFDRGWYAGPIGYCDLAGNGEFHVALRSCLFRPDRTELFAGAGIVAGSRPERELDETNLKLDALLPSLHGITEPKWRTYATASAIASAMVEGEVVAAIISPGSRSTPMAVTIARNGPPHHVVLDERSAGFVALGLAKASGRPVALLCTSGSAAANYLPAVAEADRGRVPLVVLTADRPPGFLDRDAPQTINQVGLYANMVRDAADLPVAHQCHPDEAFEVTRRAVGATYAPAAGPVHINLPFDKPLEPPTGWPKLPVKPRARWSSPEQKASDASVRLLGRFLEGAARGAIVVGPRNPAAGEAEAVIRLASSTGWPVLADGMSGIRPYEDGTVFTCGDMVVSPASVGEHKAPDAIIRVGGTPTGTMTQEWLEGLDCPQLILDPDLRRTAQGPEMVLRDPIASLLSRLSLDGTSGGDWLAAWGRAEEEVRLRRAWERTHHPDTELALAAELLDQASIVWAGSSMPVRHINAMMGRGCQARVYGNRGACGIDGAIASATGLALGSEARVFALVGDLTFLHDVGSLAVAHALGVKLTIAVLDNGGGAIFESLPFLRDLRESGQSAEYAAYRELFVTPHHQDLEAIASGFGVSTQRADPASFGATLEATQDHPDTNVVIVETDPDKMFAAYSRLYRPL